MGLSLGLGVYLGANLGQGGGVVVPAKIQLLRDHGFAAKPLVAMTSPPAFTLSAANANSSILPANYDARYPAGNAVFTYRGGQTSNVVSAGPPGPTHQRGVGANYGTGNGYQGTFDVYFQTNAPDVDLSLIAQNNIDATYRVSIDLLDGNGYRPTALAPRTDVQALADYSAHRVKLALGSVANRRYRIELDHFIWFSGVDVSLSYTLSAVTLTDPAVLVIGDSHTAATGATSRLLGMGHRLKSELGLSNVMVQGQGGTGYLATGVAGTQTMRGRIGGEITGRNPDLIIDLAGYNDSASTAGAIQTEVGLHLAAIAAVYPDVPYIKIAPPRRGVSPTFTLAQAKADAIKAAVLADPRYGDLVFHIDSYALDWEHGTGRVGATAGNGNADTWVMSDNVHRSDVGHAGWGALMGPSIRSTLGI